MTEQLLDIEDRRVGLGQTLIWAVFLNHLISSSWAPCGASIPS